MTDTNVMLACLVKWNETILTANNWAEILYAKQAHLCQEFRRAMRDKDEDRASELARQLGLIDALLEMEPEVVTPQQEPQQLALEVEA